MRSEFEQLMQTLNKIEAAKGITKIEVMKLHETELLKKVFLYALDPYKMYGVKSFTEPNYEIINVQEDSNELFRTLDALKARVITGNKAKAECEFVCAKYLVPADLLTRILNKDLRVGVAATTVNKVWPKLIPEFRVALAKEYEEDDFEFPAYASIKYDGLRCIAFCTEEEVTFYTRNGLEIISAEHIKESLSLEVYSRWGAKKVMLDGELMKSLGHFQDSSGSIRSKSEQDPSLIYRIFDYVPLEDFLNQKSKESQSFRINVLNNWENKLSSTVPFMVVKHVRVDNNLEVQCLYEAARKDGQEGLILKDPNAFYQYKRSKAWLKLKDVVTIDVKVLGIEEGKGKNMGKVGALLVDFEGKPNRVGGGMSDKERTLWYNEPELIVGRMVEVAYHEKTKEGNMRHARLIKVRFDLD